MKKISAVMVAIIFVLSAMGTVCADYTVTYLHYPGAGEAPALGINDVGTIVGFYSDGISILGYSLSGGTYTSLGTYPGVNSTIARGINNSGTIVGSYGNNEDRYGFVLSGGTYTSVQYPDATATKAYGINNAGTIVGYYNVIPSKPWTTEAYGFSLSGGTYTSLTYPNAVGDITTYARGINNAGTIVGYYSDDSGTHGFLLSGGTYSPINYPGAAATMAYGINNVGTIVGYYSDGNTACGFILIGGIYTSLSTQVPCISSQGESGISINDGGVIVGATSGGIGWVAAPTCFGDFALDGDVDGSDLAVLISKTDLMDLATFAQNYGKNTCQ
jgi:uncharacterized membrane protein